MHSALPPELINQITTGDARELSPRIPDESIDLIFTDPPYLKEYLYLYEWLAKEAARVLKPDGFLLVYAGGYWKDEVMALLRANLDYFWDYTLLMHDASVMWPRRTIAKSKSILAYTPKGGMGMPRTNVLGHYDGGGKDKAYHQWGQDENSARYYIDCFSDYGAMVLEPFCGGGTTAAVCRVLPRDYIAFEIDSVTAEKARQRVERTPIPLFVLPAEQALLW